MSITRTATGWRVSKQLKPQKRLRTIVESEDEAKRILRLYERGELDLATLGAPVLGVTWDELYTLTLRKCWSGQKSTTQQDNARRAIDGFLGGHTLAKDLTPMRALEVA